MFFGSLFSLMQQVARLVPSPGERYAHRRTARLSSDGGCGCCPICREFVYVESPQVGESVSCPSCGNAIEGLDPLGFERSK
jgi:hypothetical protein